MTPEEFNKRMDHIIDRHREDAWLLGFVAALKLVLVLMCVGVGLACLIKWLL